MREISVEDILLLIGDAIGNTEIVRQLSEQSALLRAVPELDSMAAANIMLGMERQFDFVVHDDELEEEIFETVGSLRAFAQSKLAQASN